MIIVIGMFLMCVVIIFLNWFSSGARKMSGDLDKVTNKLREYAAKEKARKEALK